MVVAMDPASYSVLDQKAGEAWDRSLHAGLLQQPCVKNAGWVVLDVVFDKPGTNYWGNQGLVKDEALARTILDHKRVSLAAFLEKDIDRDVMVRQPNIPTALFNLGTNWGFCDFPGKVRGEAIRKHYFDYEYRLNGMAWNVAKLVNSNTPPPSENQWINYYSSKPTKCYPYYVIYTNGVPLEEFTNRVVFIGKKGRLLSVDGTAYEDMHDTAFTRWTGEQMSGAEIQATAFLNLVRGDSLKEHGPLAGIVVLLVGGFYGCGLLLVRPVPGAVMAWAGVMLLAGLDLYLVEYHYYWFPWAVPALVQIPLALGWSGLIHTRRLLREKEALASELALAKQAAPQAQSDQRASTAVTTETTSTIVISDHTLLTCVGSGAYGEVWLARNLIGLYRAVKIVRRQTFDSDLPYEREFRGIEKFMPVSLNHPGLLRLLHVGCDDLERYFFYVMEAADDDVAGRAINPTTYSPRTLRRVIEKEGRLQLPECVELGLHLSDALDYLHGQQLIHRDLKPANIIYFEGAPKIADIGLVTSITGEQTSVTIIGTPGYMAPEGPGTAKADLYSLGTVLYQAFTGFPPNRFPRSHLINS